jgi:hypothetical protein
MVRISLIRSDDSNGMSTGMNAIENSRDTSNGRDASNSRDANHSRRSRTAGIQNLIFLVQCSKDYLF